MQKDQPSPSRGKLDRQSWLLLAVNALFIIASALSGTFIGVYLWKASHNFAVLGWFTLLTHFCMAVTFWTAGYWVKKGHKMMCFRLGDWDVGGILCDRLIAWDKCRTLHMVVRHSTRIRYGALLACIQCDLF